MKFTKKIFIGITGASGSIYAERLIQELLKANNTQIYVVVSNTGKQVCRYELKEKFENNENKFSLLKFLSSHEDSELYDHKKIVLLKPNDLFASIASGSSVPSDAVLCPCSMGTLSRIAHGISSNLLERTVDVVIKQKKNLIICPRETPLSTIHLENMLKLSQLGASIVPLMPAFYHYPKSIHEMVDFMVGRILEMMSIEHQLYEAWGEGKALHPII